MTALLKLARASGFAPRQRVMRFYRALLHAFPASFRGEYGEEMCAIFARRRRDASGPWGRAVLWAGVLADVLPNAARAHADILRQDLRYTGRTLRRSPGFSATAVLITALGVGAVTAAFSVTDHVLIRPLPLADAERLVQLWEDPSGDGQSQNEPSPPNYRDWKRASKSFEAMGAYHWLGANLVGSGTPQHLEGVGVDADLLPMLGVRPLIGRVFEPGDHVAGAAGTLLLSEGTWKRRFGGDPGIAGKKVLLDEEPFTVIGVLPRQFQFPTRGIEIWAPMRLDEDNSNDRTNNFFHVVGKLKRGVSLTAARAEMRVIAAQLERAYPRENKHTGAVVVGLRDQISRPVPPPAGGASRGGARRSADRVHEPREPVAGAGALEAPRARRADRHGRRPGAPRPSAPDREPRPGGSRGRARGRPGDRSRAVDRPARAQRAADRRGAAAWTFGCWGSPRLLTLLTGLGFGVVPALRVLQGRRTATAFARARGPAPIAGRNACAPRSSSPR